MPSQSSRMSSAIRRPYSCKEQDAEVVHKPRSKPLTRRVLFHKTKESTSESKPASVQGASVPVVATELQPRGSAQKVIEKDWPPTDDPKARGSKR